MEYDVSQIEELSFSQLAETRDVIAAISGHPTSAGNNQYTSRVNGSIDGGVGPNILLKVMAGDSYNLSCISWWKQGDHDPGAIHSDQSALINQLMGQMAGGVSPLSTLHNTAS